MPTPPDIPVPPPLGPPPEPPFPPVLFPGPPLFLPKPPPADVIVVEPVNVETAPAEPDWFAVPFAPPAPITTGYPVAVTDKPLFEPDVHVIGLEV